MSPRHVFSLAPVKPALDTYGDAVDIYSSNGPNIGDPTYTWGIQPRSVETSLAHLLIHTMKLIRSIYKLLAADTFRRKRCLVTKLLDAADNNKTLIGFTLH